MKTNYLLTLSMAAAFLVTANARADLVTLYTDNAANGNDRDAYMQLAGASEWALVGSAAFDKAKAPYDGVFTVTNLLDQYRDENNQVGNLQGSYTMNSWDGMGSGYAHTLHGAGVDTGLTFSHNSANQFGVATPEGIVNAFYLNVDFHANESSTQGVYNISFYGANGELLQTFTNVAIGWAGFIFEEDAYLTRFEITTIGNKNTGYSFDMVLGDGSVAVPEPATLAMIGLGIAGVGLAARRKMKKQD